MQVTISLTSPLMREDPAADRDKQAAGEAAEKGQRGPQLSLARQTEKKQKKKQTNSHVGACV